MFTFLCHKHHDLLISGSAEEFNYTRMGGSTVLEGVNDRADMIETQKTFTLLGFKEDFQMDVFKVLAAILYLGNVQIAAVGNERSVISIRYVT